MKVDNRTTRWTAAFLVAFTLPTRGIAEGEINSLVTTPIVEVDGVSYEISGVKLNVKEQMENLIGTVNSLEERSQAIDNGLEKLEKRIDALEKSLDKRGVDIKETERLIAVNEFMISLLSAEKESVIDELNIKENITLGKCVSGAQLVNRSEEGIITCAQNTPSVQLLNAVSTTSGLDTLFASYFAVIPPSGKTTITMTCPDNYVAAAAGHYLPASLVVIEQSRPDALDSHNWILRYANWDTYTRYASGYLNCLRAAP